MVYGVLALSIAAWALRNAVSNGYGKILKTTADNYLFNGIGAVVGLLLCLAAGGSFVMAPETWLFGAALGIVNSLYLLFLLLAMQTGPLSISVMSCSFSLIIPTLLGSLYWDETMTPVQIVGLCLLLLSFYLSTKPSDSTPVTGKWIVYCLLTFLICGATGPIQKLHQDTAAAHETSSLILAAFSASALLFFILTLLAARKEPLSIQKQTAPRFLAGSIITGVLFTLVSLLNVYLIGELPSAVFFPVFNGGAVVINTLVDVLIFRQHLSRRQVIGVVLGTVSVVLVGNVTALFGL